MTSAPPITSGSRRPEGALRALAVLRERLRRAFLCDGVVAVVLMVLALTISAFLLDYLLVLPRGVRLVLLGAVLCYLAWFIYRRLYIPARVPLSEEDLAVLVEARAPELSQSLITAVELSRPGHAGAGLLSPELIGSVVAEAEKRGGGG